MAASIGLWRNMIMKTDSYGNHMGIHHVVDRFCYKLLYCTVYVYYIQ